MPPFKVVAAVLALVAAAAARPNLAEAGGHAHGAAPAAPHTGYDAPPPPPPPIYGPPPPTKYGHPEPETEKPKYEFDWEVKDHYSGNDFGQQESRDGYHTEGSFFTLLPDGRIQKTTYTVLKDGGFVATVQFDGEIKHEQKGYGYTPPPKTYGPPPTTPPATYGPPPTTPPATYGPPPTTPPATYGPPPTTPPATYGPPPTTPPATYGPPPAPPATLYGQPAANGHE